MEYVKKMMIIFTLVILSFGLAACNGGNQETNSGSASSPSGGEEMTIRLGSHLPPSHSVIAVTEKFKEIVEENSDGRITVEIHPSGELGGQSELIQSLQVGSVEMTINDAGVLSNFAPKVGVLDLPYTFKDYDHVHKVLDSPVAEELEKELDAIGIKSIGWVDSAFRDLLVNKEVSSIEDVNGQKIRVPDAPQYLRTVQSWGASASTIPWGDLYTSLETGVVDGFEGSAESIHSSALHEVVDYRVPTEHIFTVLSLNISKSVFEGMSSEDQTLIEEAGREAALYGRDLAMERDVEYKEKLEEEGLKTLEIDKENYKKAAMDFVNEYAKEIEVTDLLEEIKELQ
jgi:TRAP-type transport system periplasmic protein